MCEEWGPWIEHDGKGCPCVGMWVESVSADGLNEQHIAGGWCEGGPGIEVDCWTWMECAITDSWDWRIIRYRIHRPKWLQEMIERIESLPVPELVE